MSLEMSHYSQNVGNRIRKIGRKGLEFLTIGVVALPLILGTGYFVSGCDNPEKQSGRATLQNDPSVGGGSGGGSGGNNSDCIVPYSGMILTNDTTLCKDTYNLPSDDFPHGGLSRGAINFGRDNITLDCNGATIIGDHKCWNDNDLNGMKVRVGIAVEDVSKATVKNCIVQDYCTGINVWMAKDFLIEKNSLYNNGSDFSQTFGDNIQVVSSTDFTIRNNYIKNGSEGIYLVHYNQNAIILGNTLEGTNNGVFCDSENGEKGCSNIVVEDNSFADLLYVGIGFENSDNILIRNNTVNSFGQNGLRFESVKGSTIHTNTIQGGSFNQEGVFFDGNSTDNLFYNNFLENSSNVLDDGRNNLWSTDLDCTLKNILGGNCTGGNFYSDYSGFDTDSDGIGDTTYLISGIAGSVDYFPLFSYE